MLINRCHSFTELVRVGGARIGEDLGVVLAWIWDLAEVCVSAGTAGFLLLLFDSGCGLSHSYFC
jgi:hypothetical protein